MSEIDSARQAFVTSQIEAIRDVIGKNAGALRRKDVSLPGDDAKRVLFYDKEDRWLLHPIYEAEIGSSGNYAALNDYRTETGMSPQLFPQQEARVDRRFPPQSRFTFKSTEVYDPYSEEIHLSQVNTRRARQEIVRLVQEFVTADSR